MNTLQRLFSDNWAVQRHDLKGLMALLMPCVVKGNLQGAEALLSKRRIQSGATAFPYMAGWWDMDDPSLPEGSVAVIRLKDMLYSWDTEFLISQIRMAEANDRIVGIVLEVDGPGGMVSHVAAASEALRRCTKPTATAVTGLMASAHFWIGTSTLRTFIETDLCEVGSCGVVTTYCSFREFFKMNGIDYREIYPDTADLKNKPTRVLEDDGDETLIKARAERIHMLFAATVADNLGVKYDAEDPLFRGEMFPADVALEKGYVDERGGVAEAVRWVVAQAAISRIPDEKE